MMYLYNAKIVKVLDGDTFDADVDLGFHITTRQRFRILGYNAPETKGPEKPMGLIAKTHLEDIFWKYPNFLLTSEKGDAFGRWLAHVSTGEGADITLELIDAGYGVAWDGKGERPKFDPTQPYPLIK